MVPSGLNKDRTVNSLKIFQLFANKAIFQENVVGKIKK